MTDETKQELTAPPPTSVPTLTPNQLALMRKVAGKQKFSVKELTIPQLKIVQTSGGYMKKSNPDYIKEAEEGQFIDTLTLQLRNAPIELIVVRVRSCPTLSIISKDAQWRL